MKNILALLVLIIAFSCQEKPQNLDTDTILAKSIAQVGGPIIDTSTVSFTFRNRFYSATRKNGLFKLQRCSDAACKDTLDQLSNSDFKRFIKGQEVPLADSLVPNLMGSVNSVHYFSVLPYGLDAEAVNAEKIGEAIVNGQTYYKIKVSFSEDGGGEDFEDMYMYWINTKTFTVDYLAYNYHVNEGGTRFREAYNPREIKGVRVVDYNNYEPKAQFPPLASLDSLFSDGKLKLLSKIELEDVTVN